MDYLKKHYLEVYISDATYKLVARKHKDPKTRSLPFLLDYFVGVRSGYHVFKRRYKYVSATPYNRQSFIKITWQAFVNLIQQQVPMKGQEYHQLLQLLCNDFPISLIEQVINVITHHKPSQDSITFTEFIYTLQVIFYYQEFLNEVGNIFSRSGESSIIVLPPKDTDTENIQNEMLPLAQFTLSIQALHEKICSNKPWLVLPSLTSLNDVIPGSTHQVTMLDFLSYLCECEQINKQIGVLPPRELFLTTEPPVINKIM